MKSILSQACVTLLACFLRSSEAQRPQPSRTPSVATLAPTLPTLASTSCDINAPCGVEGSRCTGGATETCCGETFDSLGCECVNIDGILKYACYFTEACSGVTSCETFEPLVSTNSPTEGLHSNTATPTPLKAHEPTSNKYFVDYATGSCSRDCAPGPFGCAAVPPPVALYDSIEACCSVGQSWVDFRYCTSRSVGDYTDEWIVDYQGEKCVKDCNPAEGPPCSNPEHKDLSAKIYATPTECCGRLGWVDLSTCMHKSASIAPGPTPGGTGPSNKYFVDYATGSCFRDCAPGPFGCAAVPRSIALYDSIEACCSVGQSWVDFGYCTSRSVGDYTDGWVVDYQGEKCVKDCNPADGLPCSNPEHKDLSAKIYATPAECCRRLGWVDDCTCNTLPHAFPPSLSGANLKCIGTLGELAEEYKQLLKSSDDALNDVEVSAHSAPVLMTTKAYRNAVISGDFETMKKMEDASIRNLEPLRSNIADHGKDAWTHYEFPNGEKILLISNSKAMMWSYLEKHPQILTNDHYKYQSIVQYGAYSEEGNMVSKQSFLVKHQDEIIGAVASMAISLWIGRIVKNFLLNKVETLTMSLAEAAAEAGADSASFLVPTWAINAVAVGASAVAGSVIALVIIPLVDVKYTVQLQVYNFDPTNDWEIRQIASRNAINPGVTGGWETILLPKLNGTVTPFPTQLKPLDSICSYATIVWVNSVHWFDGLRSAALLSPANSDVTVGWAFNCPWAFDKTQAASDLHQSFDIENYLNTASWNANPKSFTVSLPRLQRTIGVELDYLNQAPNDLYTSKVSIIDPSSTPTQTLDPLPTASPTSDPLGPSGKYTNVWVVDHEFNRCTKDCDPANGLPCKAHTDISATVFDTPDLCCGSLLGQLDLAECVTASNST